MAASSSRKRYRYDVFLSFSGEDTRRTFVDYLNDALQRHGIRTFKDDERLQQGKKIKEELLKSIDDSGYFIIVFSKKYASSSWCLDELVRIMECQKTTDQTAFPVFYDVEPSEVRKQSGSVGEALAKHAKKVAVGKTLTRTVVRKALARHTNKKLGQWRKALKDAANLCGWELKNTAQGHEAKVIKLIVERVSLELRSINMGVDENLIGMERRMQALDACLEIGLDDVRMVGIKGMGGAGKTTLARAVFDKISIKFEGKSFVENVREISKAPLLGLKKLQEQILRDVLQDKSITVSSVHEGANSIKTMLCGKKILLVLDDVDHKDQLEELVGEQSWFKPGSRIIITTRDEQVLIAHRVKWIRDIDLLSKEEAARDEQVLITRQVKWIYDVNLLSKEEAIQLFCRNAFGKDVPPERYKVHSLEVVRYADGLPLTIKVLGSFLCGKNEPEWIDALARLKIIPLVETLQKLKLSYDGLENDYKEIFLDVACFYRQRSINKAIRMLESCGFHARSGLRVLQQKSLITIDQRNKINMHDHIEEMGKNIVHDKHPDEPHRRSRLWVQEEIEHVLANDLCSEATRCINLKIIRNTVLEDLRKMKKLRCLIVKKEKENDFLNDQVKNDGARQYFPNSLQYLYWHRYPHWCLPKTFEANNLVTLDMSKSFIKQLWEKEKVMKRLKFLNLSYTSLRSLDLGLTPNLEWLDLKKCTDLVELNIHGGCIKSLTYLNLDGCESLKSSLVSIEALESLKVLYIGGVKMREFPEYITTGHSINSLLELQLSDNRSIKEIPSSIGNLHKLVSLDICGYYRLKSIPGSICSLQHLTSLNLSCIVIEELPEDLGQLECLEHLDLTFTPIRHLPNSICMLKRLKTLLLQHCGYLEKLPEDVGHLEYMEVLDLRYCSKLRDIPSSICKLKHLKKLDLHGCWRIKNVPD